MDDQKCNCRNSISNKDINMKSSKIIQTPSTDSDVFYDVPDENDSPIPTYSNRSGATQNDRNRDHTNLSYEPNIEAPAGSRQQPSAGQRQTYQAKDKNNENDDGNNTNKERLSLGNYFTPRDLCLCLNVSQDGFSNLSSEAGSSIVKLSFSKNACTDLQGSYECFCDEEGEEGSCHKFRCRKFEVLENKKKTLLKSQKESIERNEDNETTIACCSQKMIIDGKTKPAYECLCVRKSLIVSSCTGICKSEDIERVEFRSSSRTGRIPYEIAENTDLSCNDPNNSVEKNRPGLNRRIMSKLEVQKCNNSSKYIGTDSESIISNATEDLCPCENIAKSARENTTGSSESLPLKNSKNQNGGQSRKTNFSESCPSVGTSTTPRHTMDENVIPLLKSIFDVLQTMREEKLHLGPIASRNIELHLDEPFNGLAAPPPPTAPPSSPKTSRDLQGFPFDSQTYKSKPLTYNLGFEVETDRDFINSENNLAILEPPERDVEDLESHYYKTSTTSQRLIPVDMDLLRTDEELIWEPDSNFDKPEYDEDGKRKLLPLHSSQMEEVEPLNAQFLQFPDDMHPRLSKDLKICGSSSCQRENSQGLYHNEKAESTSRLSILKRSSLEEVQSCEYACEEPENSTSSRNCPSNDQITTPIVMKSSLQNLMYNKMDENNYQKIENSQAVQVNLMPLQNFTSRSAQFHSQLEDLSDEKLLKASEIRKSKEIVLSTMTSQQSPAKLDAGTDCPDFGSDDRSSITARHYSQESNEPQNHEMTQFIESILCDLKAMNSFRKNNSHWQSFARLPCPSTGGWLRPSKDLSYPVTIEKVQELGANSLFVKWRVQNIGNIGGYEIFLDGHLTNRYFNCIHRAAVICDVDLHCPHRITLRAQPLLPISTSLLASDSCTSPNSNTKCPSNTTTTRPEASCPQPDGSVWYPSVYHFEPNSLSAAPTNAVLY